MYALAPRELLRVWESGVRASHATRGLLLMGAALPQVDTAVLLQSTIGHRDAWILSLREVLFGPRIECLLSCPACGERMELDFSVNEIRSAHAEPRHVCEVPVEGTTWRFRVPTSADLLAIEHESDARAAGRRLLERCWDGTDAEPDAALPQPVASHASSVVDAAMSQADPQAEVLLELSCPACGHCTSQVFDIVDYLWSEIDLWARGMLRKVHAIASRYGWSEDDILAMSPPRRQAYLDIIGAP